jgi:hypothetical protein
MLQNQQTMHGNPFLLAAALTALLAPWLPAQAATSIDEHRAANPRGSIEVINVAGKIDIQGWEKSEVAVSGTVGKDVERVDVTSEGDRTSIRVVLRSQHGWGSGSEGEAHLMVHVPTNSSISTSLVSSDLNVTGVRGDVTLQTLSGNVTGDVGGDVHANVVSGNVALSANAAKAIEVKVVSGDVVLSGGDADTQVTTVSGDAKISLKTPSRARFQTVSGNIAANLAIGAESQIDGESVSGDIKLDFGASPTADFDIQSFSGEIDNCFGPKPAEARHGPGSRLTFRTGDSRARVRISTKSGRVGICAKGERPSA